MDERESNPRRCAHTIEIESQGKELMYDEDRKGCTLVPCFNDGRGEPVEELVSEPA